MLKPKINFLPDSSGVYLMKDKTGGVIYVGKARSIKKRLMSYFGRGLSTKTLMLMANVADIEYRLCPTESMALFLEASLIRKYRPRYNISLRDDKSFPFVKITAEEFPAICITRRREPDGSRYIGPFTSAGLLREALSSIRRHFPYRACRELKQEERIYRKIGLSPEGVSKEGYRERIKNIILLLEGRTEELVKKLSAEMALKSKEEKFEEAARLRNQINALGAMGEVNAFAGSEFELEALSRLLKLRKIPQRIEAFDISNIYGREATGSMVSFYRGLADKNSYRRFRIKTVGGIDDYAMLSEVVRRRYERVIEEKLPLPGLILVDGGRQHLLAAERILKGLSLDIPLAGIAKPPKKTHGHLRPRRQEHIYVRGQPRPLRLKGEAAALNLIRRIRDEAHRFAVSYHHILRRKKVIGNR